MSRSLKSTAALTILLLAVLLLSACNSTGGATPSTAEESSESLLTDPHIEQCIDNNCVELTVPEPETSIRALWVWGSQVVFEADARKRLFELVDQKGLNRLYLEAYEALRYDQDALAGFFTEAAQRGIDVELLFGQPDWALPENHHHVMSLIDRVADFAGRYPDISVAGIHLDVEPYLLPQWDQDRQTLISGFIDLLEIARQRSHYVGFSLMADIPVWYDDHGIFRDGLARTLHELVIDATDGVGLMDYRDQKDRIIADAHNELTYASQTGKAVVVGVETMCIEPTWITFCEEGAAVMEAVLGEIDPHLGTYTSYKGYAVHHLDSYLVLKP